MKSQHLLSGLLLTLACQQHIPVELEEGVSRELAIQRKRDISLSSYALRFSIPEKKTEPIPGSAAIGLELKSTDHPVILDFKADDHRAIKALKVNGTDRRYQFAKGHIVLSVDCFERGYNEIDIDFLAGDRSLNRADEFLYTLFVPDRASTAFPCFDQPDLKAKYYLSLEIPAGWSAMSNAEILSEESTADIKTVVFAESDLLSTYLFSFVAGRFESLTRSIGGVEMTMFHREPDSAKVSANIDEIFRQHYDALRWMEDYTDIKYPFQKFDFAILPAFQYGGMEHTGAIQYRASRMFLEESATLNDALSRSMLIAHETAHMWFGNLVTMEWFDDVWMKEVFANFMASKITSAKFKEVNHDLNFLFSHYPQAYAVDRTEGANAVRQQLDNLKNAGTMYGAIIYHKAPIVMRQLEVLMGQDAFREGLREYLSSYSGKHAAWTDLVTILDLKSDLNLAQWSKVWIEEAGMPFIDIELVEDGEGNSFDLIQYDPAGNGRIWQQKFKILYGYASQQVYFRDKTFSLGKTNGTVVPEFIQLNSDGLGYGIFASGLDYNKEEFSFNTGLLDIPSIQDDLARGSAYLALHEYLLHEGVNPIKYIKMLEDYILAEENELILDYLLGNLETIYWEFLSLEQSRELAPELESLLVQKMQRIDHENTRHLLFKKYVSMCQSRLGIKNLMRFWAREAKPMSLDLTEEEEIMMAYHIELKAGQITEVLKDQIARIENPDKRAEVEFVSHALSLEQAERDVFFASLLKAENREREAWVNKALRYLHHPVRRQHSVTYLRRSLEILPEIQSTGDIFFPKRWLDNTLWGHNSTEAVQRIKDYLAENPQLDPNLKMKVLQSADMVFRAERDLVRTRSE